MTQPNKFEELINALRLLEEDRSYIESKMQVCPDSLMLRCQIFLDNNRAVEEQIMRQEIGPMDFDGYAYLHGQNFTEGWASK